MSRAKQNKTCIPCVVMKNTSDFARMIAKKSKAVAPKPSAINVKNISAAAGAIASVITARSKKVQEMRKKRERELARQRKKCTRNAVIAGVGGVAAGLAAGYFAARSLQLTERFAERDTDIYKKNPTLSDYAPSPAPSVAAKEYLPFDDDSKISTDGTTILTRN